MSFLSALSALLLLLCCLSSSYLLALGLGVRRSGSLRACATLGLAYALLMGLFELLSALSSFTPWVAVPLWALFTALLVSRLRTRAVPALRWDLGRARVLGRRVLKGPARWLLLVALLPLFARLLRGLAAPPLAWDAITYHLVKAGRWVQFGGYEPLLAPDAWGYYEFFLPYGDVLWAWAMLPVRGDGFLAPAGLLVWVSALVGAYGTARALGARRSMAVPAALATAFVPAMVNGFTSAYVDTLVLALFLLAMAPLLASMRSGSGGERVAAAAALGVLAGIKPGGLPVLCLGAVVLGVGLVRARRSGQGARLHGWLVGLGLLLGALPYLRTWAVTGSPLYPWPLSVAGVTLSEGNPELAAVHSGLLFGYPSVDVGNVVRSLLLSDFLQGWDHLGLGPALLLAPLGLVAAVRAFQRRRWGHLVLLVCGLSTLLGVISQVLWTVWVSNTPRFLAPAVATLLLLAATLEGRWLRTLLWVCFGVELLLTLPRGWSAVDVRGVLSVAVPVLLALALGAGAVWLGARRGRVVLGVAVAAVLLAVSHVPLASTREALRYDFYAAAREMVTFDLHPLQPKYVSSWPIWKALDDERPKRLAVTAGWDGYGFNWFWYPLMGSQLQNVLTYVPVLPDGSVRDYALPETLQQADFQAWLPRLVEAEVDHVVTLAPEPLEASWLSAHPELFQPLATSLNGQSVAWRVGPAGAGAPP
jgi:hypothetical protein